MVESVRVSRKRLQMYRSIVQLSPGTAFYCIFDSSFFSLVLRAWFCGEPLVLVTIVNLPHTSRRSY